MERPTQFRNQTAQSMSPSAHLHCSVTQVEEIKLLMMRHGVLLCHLMFWSTNGSLIIKLTSSTAELRGIVQFVISMVQGLSCEFHFTVQAWELTYREPGNGPHCCGACRDLTSLSRLPPPHWEKSFTSLMMHLKLRRFPIEASEACLSIHNHRRDSALSPLTKLPSHFGGFTKQYTQKETFIKQPWYQPAFHINLRNSM